MSINIANKSFLMDTTATTAARRGKGNEKKTMKFFLFPATMSPVLVKLNSQTYEKKDRRHEKEKKDKTEKEEQEDEGTLHEN